MEINKQSKLRFLGVNIINIQYSINAQIDASKSLELFVEPKVFFPKDAEPGTFSIVMTVQLKYEDQFNLTISSIGNFIHETEEPEQKVSFIHSNAPAIMFPYLRAFVSTLTSNLGGIVNPIIIPPHFFKGEIEELSDPISEQLEAEHS